MGDVTLAERLWHLCAAKSVDKNRELRTPHL